MPSRSSPDKGFSQKSPFSETETLSLHEAVLHASGLALISTTPEGLITGFNRSAESLLRYSAAEVIGKETPAIFHDADEVIRCAKDLVHETGKKSDPTFDVIWNTGNTGRNEWTFVRKDGSRFTGSLTVIVLRDNHDRVTKYAGIIADLTQQKRLTGQEGLTLQLQEQNRRLDEFAHIISHNLRAPVNNIQALINLLNDQSEIADYKLIFDKLKNVAKNLSETMNELMDTLKVKTQPHVDRTEIRFKEVLDKVVQSLEGELIVAHASVTFDFNEAPAILYSKPYLESIFQNLLTNAIKYKSPDRKPTIHFRSSRAGNHLELQVTDNGQGIDMEKFGDKLFGLHKTFHNHQEARGVGLFLVKSQIEALGGSIRVSSEVDKGTTFTIRFN